MIDSGARQITETSNFDGDHFVECYAVKNGVCVARDEFMYLYSNDREPASLCIRCVGRI